MRAVLRIAVIAALLALSGPMAPAVFADEDSGDRWWETFKGHEMWLSDLAAATKLSTEESRPLLVDIFNPG
ncbi:MAG TPA: hypothetical protein VGB22_07355 [candidate division Zixibacteria bacterium]|jgi:hypothetical protein